MKDERHCLTYGELADFSKSFIREHSRYENTNLAVKFSSRFIAAKMIPAFSKLAKSLFFVPSNISAELEKELCNKLGIDFVVDIDDEKIVWSSFP